MKLYSLKYSFTALVPGLPVLNQNLFDLYSLPIFTPIVQDVLYVHSVIIDLTCNHPHFQHPFFFTDDKHILFLFINRYDLVLLIISSMKCLLYKKFYLNMKEKNVIIFE
jgi:hypothetical protein